MDEIVIELKLIGVCGRDWPEMQVLFNNDLLYHKKVVGQQLLKFSVPATELNLIQIKHINKNSDTVVVDDCIVSDRHCLIDAVTLNGIVMDINFCFQIKK